MFPRKGSQKIIVLKYFLTKISTIDENFRKNIRMLGNFLNDILRSFELFYSRLNVDLDEI